MKVTSDVMSERIDLLNPGGTAYNVEGLVVSEGDRLSPKWAKLIAVGNAHETEATY